MKPPKELIRFWYQRLREEGFEDIEDTDSPRQLLKEWHSTKFLDHADGVRSSARQKYYEMATHFLHAHQFESEMEYTIWEMHSNGLSLRKIAKEVSSQKRTFSKDEVAKIIKTIRGKMRDATTSGH